MFCKIIVSVICYFKFCSIATIRQAKCMELSRDPTALISRTAGSENIHKSGAADLPRRPLADTFLYGTPVPVNAYQRTKFQLPSSINFRGGPKIKSGAANLPKHPLADKFLYGALVLQLRTQQQKRLAFCNLQHFQQNFVTNTAFDYSTEINQNLYSSRILVSRHQTSQNIHPFTLSHHNHTGRPYMFSLFKLNADLSNLIQSPNLIQQYPPSKLFWRVSSFNSSS